MSLGKSLVWVALGTALLLSIPLVVMQFSQEAAWTLSDFLAADILLFGTGLTYVLLASKSRNTAYKLAMGVGFIGSEDNPTNLLYGAVLAVGFLGAIVARFRPLGMARTMFAAALTQFLVPLVAALICRLEVDAAMVRVLTLNTLFAGLWVGSGMLFRRAAGAHAIQGQ